MSSLAGQPIEESLLLKKCQQGDAAALSGVRAQYHSALINILHARGATATEAEDLLADLWGECVAGADDRPSLLEKYSGKCSLQNWLATVATHRWIDLKRKHARRGQTIPVRNDDGSTSFFERVPAEASAQSEQPLVELLRGSLEAAFAACSPESLLMLRLVYLHGLTQRELVRMWGWHESKVSRQLSAAMTEIKTRTLNELKRRDQFLQLTWEDFLELCQTQQVGFL